MISLQKQIKYLRLDLYEWLIRDVLLIFFLNLSFFGWKNAELFEVPLRQLEILELFVYPEDMETFLRQAAKKNQEFWKDILKLDMATWKWHHGAHHKFKMILKASI